MVADFGARSLWDIIGSSVDPDFVFNMIGIIEKMDSAAHNLNFIFRSTRLQVTDTRDRAQIISSIRDGTVLIEIILGNMRCLHRILGSMKKLHPAQTYFISVYPKYETAIKEGMSCIKELREKLREWIEHVSVGSY